MNIILGIICIVGGITITVAYLQIRRLYKLHVEEEFEIHKNYILSRVIVIGVFGIIVSCISIIGVFLRK